jgi:hypothetical protein
LFWAIVRQNFIVGSRWSSKGAHLMEDRKQRKPERKVWDEDIPSKPHPQ